MASERTGRRPIHTIEETGLLPRLAGVEDDVGVSMVRTFHHGDFDPARVAATKGDLRISVCLPARNEQKTVGPIIESIDDQLRSKIALVDEILVVDDHSTDDTSRVARNAGATVVTPDQVLADHDQGPGKGQALWRSLAACRGDIVVWCDADVRNYSPTFVTALAGTLIDNPDLKLVKGFYERPRPAHGEGGGRVTELLARPTLSLLFPELTPIVQPLAGEYAGRREALEQLPFVGGYGVDLALLIDAFRSFGLGAIAQVDLGERVHRNRPLDELSVQALEVLHAALDRVGGIEIPDYAHLVRPGQLPRDHTLVELPPLATIPAHERRSA